MKSFGFFKKGNFTRSKKTKCSKPVQTGCPRQELPEEISKDVGTHINRCIYLPFPEAGMECSGKTMDLRALEVKVKCPRCQRLYDNDQRLPKRLIECEHTVCLNCAYKLLAYEFWTLRCPVCACVSELPLRNRMSAMPVDKEALFSRNLYVNLAFIQRGG